MRGEGDRGAGEALDALVFLVGTLQHDMAVVGTRYDLTPQQVLLVRALGSSRSMHAVAESLGCDPSNVTGRIDRLERRGLVQRGADPKDRRVRLLSLTSAGRELRGALERELARGAAVRGLTGAGRAPERAVLCRLVDGLRADPLCGARGDGRAEAEGEGP